MNKFDIKSYIYIHFKDNAVRYYLILFSVLLGFVVGIILSLSGFSHTSLLKVSDKTLLEFISGTAAYSDIFLSRLISIVCLVLIIFVFNLVHHTAFLNYLLIGYQACLVVLVANAVISIYGVVGIINSFVILIPINILNIFTYSYLTCICMKRASDSHNLNSTFGEGFKNSSFWIEFTFALIILFVFCMIYSFVLPFFIKSFVLITY